MTGSGRSPSPVECPDCEGMEGCNANAWAWDDEAGITEESPCTLCDGTGYLTAPARVSS